MKRIKYKHTRFDVSLAPNGMPKFMYTLDGQNWYIDCRPVTLAEFIARDGFKKADRKSKNSNLVKEGDKLKKYIKQSKNDLAKLVHNYSCDNMTTVEGKLYNYFRDFLEMKIENAYSKGFEEGKREMVEEIFKGIDEWVEVFWEDEGLTKENWENVEEVKASLQSYLNLFELDKKLQMLKKK